MATLVLGALGTLVGGPIGGAIGALAGQQIDNQIIGNNSREGPRLKELSVTTSSYGTPIPRQYGKMRSAGSIIWATELQENKESGGGSKGQPSTTTFSYSSSFAVLLASRPIVGIGRIWADGNLLRGASGDLKTAGSLRIHRGFGNQEVDPLIASAEGSACPAFRNCAYAVFENLQLEDFGNRIPTLSFEIFADETTLSVGSLLEESIENIESDVALDRLSGLTYEGGSLASMLETVKTFYPSSVTVGGEKIHLRTTEGITSAPLLLSPAAIGWDEGGFGEMDGQTRERGLASNRVPSAIRYYDVGRDYQPGVQRRPGRSSHKDTSTAQFPGALDANTARELVDRASTRAAWKGERLKWRVAVLDPAITTGSKVQVPGNAGDWIVQGWEWRERGIELDLFRLPPFEIANVTGDSGLASPPLDSEGGPSMIRAFELPWDGVGSSSERQIYATVSSPAEGWKGASLYLESGSELLPIGSSGRAFPPVGILTKSLRPSRSLILEREAHLELEILAGEATFSSGTADTVAAGRNQILVGDELLQFTTAEQLDPVRWRLTGLLRGRGGTEASASTTHHAGTDAIPLGSDVLRIESERIGLLSQPRIAAIGHSDPEPVFSLTSNAGASLRPLTPVHPRQNQSDNGHVEYCWTRRARGAWSWLSGLETPLNEEVERYRVGIGDFADPEITWEVLQPETALSTEQRAVHIGKAIWVRQIGRADQSEPLTLGTIL